jgi:hypothetical protein
MFTLIQNCSAEGFLALSIISSTGWIVGHFGSLKTGIWKVRQWGAFQLHAVKVGHPDTSGKNIKQFTGKNL